MKIEIGESLVRSWLRHVKGCQFAELNWKPSPRWNISSETELSNMFCALKDLYQGYFNQTKSWSQFIHQGEIDVFGMKYQFDTSVELFAVDIAYHGGGLNYGSREETVKNVIKKLARSAMIVNAYFPNTPATVSFVSPKTSTDIYNDIDRDLMKLREYFERLGKNVSVEAILNNSFAEQIFNPTCSISEYIADTSEIFIRSKQLIDMIKPAQNAQIQQVSNRNNHHLHMTKRMREVYEVLQRGPISISMIASELHITNNNVRTIFTYLRQVGVIINVQIINRSRLYNIVSALT